MKRPNVFLAGAAAAAIGVVVFCVAVSTYVETPSPEDSGAVAAREAPLPDRAAHELRVAAKDAVARDLLAGRTTLPEAAALFGWLNDLPPDAAPIPPQLPQVLELEPRAYDARELLLIQVVVWAEGCTRVEFPSRALDQSRHLRARLRDALAHHVKLPEVDPDRATALLARVGRDDSTRSGRSIPSPPPVGE